MDANGAVSPPYVAGPIQMHPFRALMLSPRTVGDPASFRLLARPYRTVATRLRRWRERGDLWRDQTPALYLHEYTSGGVTVRGFVGALDLTSRAASAKDAVIFPHEGIHPRQADGLADRMEEMLVQPAPILLLQEYPDGPRTAAETLIQTPPLRTYTDQSGQHHRIWALRDDDLIAALNAQWAGSTALIADGHHRYAAYLRAQARNPGTSHDQGLAMIIDQSSTPLYPGPIHRVFRGTTIADLQQAVRAVGLEARALPADSALSMLAPHQLLATNSETWVAIAVPEETTPVEFLHTVITPTLPRGPVQMIFRPSVDAVLQDVRPDKDIAIILPQIGVQEIWRIVRRGDQLPEKATSFQPKPSPGTLMRSLRDH